MLSATLAPFVITKPTTELCFDDIKTRRATFCSQNLHTRHRGTSKCSSLHIFLLIEYTYLGKSRCKH